MKAVLFIALFSLCFGFQAQAQSASVLNGADDVLVCAKQHHTTIVNSYALVMLRQSQSSVYYENSSGGSEGHTVDFKRATASSLVVRHGNETVAFDLRNGTATWTEDGSRFGENYSSCASFARYDVSVVQTWLRAQMRSWSSR